MSQSANGDSGVGIETVFNDKVIIVGDHPNLNPTVNIDPVGKEINNYKITGSGGVVKTKSAIPKNTPIDNSGDFHGGTFTIHAMNSFNIEAANGGIDIVSGGNIKISSWGGIFNIIGTVEASINGQLISINCTNTTMLNGPTLYVDTDETIFNKNVIFGNNVIVNGGMVVNGELIATHITAMRSVNMTAPSSTLYGYPIEGATLKFIADDNEFIANISITLSSPIVEGDELISGKANIIIPKTAPAAIKVASPIKDFVKIDPHYHVFDGPAMSLVDGTSALFSQMSAAENTEPMSAKPNLPMDMSLNDLANKAVSMLKLNT